MSTEPRTFYRIACDHPGCTAILGDDEDDFWLPHAVEELLRDADWLAIDEDDETDIPGARLFDLRTYHYCIDHWMICAGCDQRRPLWSGLWVDDGEAWLCQGCKP